MPQTHQMLEKEPSWILCHATWLAFQWIKNGVITYHFAFPKQWTQSTLLHLSAYQSATGPPPGNQQTLQSWQLDPHKRHSLSVSWLAAFWGQAWNWNVCILCHCCMGSKKATILNHGSSKPVGHTRKQNFAACFCPPTKRTNLPGRRKKPSAVSSHGLEIKVAVKLSREMFLAKLFSFLSYKSVWVDVCVVTEALHHAQTRKQSFSGMKGNLL